MKIQTIAAAALGVLVFAGSSAVSRAQSQKRDADFTKTEGLLSVCRSEGSFQQLLCFATIMSTADAVENVAAIAQGMVTLSKETMPPSLERTFDGLMPTEKCGSGQQPTNGHLRDIVIKRIKKAGYTETDESVDSIMVALATGPICKDTTE